MRVRRQPVTVKPVGLVALVVTRQRAAAVLLLITAAFVVQGAVLGYEIERVQHLRRGAITALKDRDVAACLRTNQLLRRLLRQFDPHARNPSIRASLRLAGDEPCHRLPHVDIR